MYAVFSRLRFRLALIALLAAIPALGLVLYTAFEQRNQAAVQAQQEAMRLARMLATDSMAEQDRASGIGR